MAASYVTGAHALKVGFTFHRDTTGTARLARTPISCSGIAALPRLATSSCRAFGCQIPFRFHTPHTQQSNLDGDIGIYLQDSWRINRHCEPGNSANICAARPRR
jgi:hypothetical protein